MKVRTIATTALLAAATTLPMASPASAAPTGCSKAMASSFTSIAVCSGGSGSYRAYIRCRWQTGSTTYESDFYGQWRRPGDGGYSYASCTPPSGWLFLSVVRYGWQTTG